jgi:hypothetical protein
VGIWKPTVSITTPRLISSLKMLTWNKVWYWHQE